MTGGYLLVIGGDGSVLICQIAPHELLHNSQSIQLEQAGENQCHTIGLLHPHLCRWALGAPVHVTRPELWWLRGRGWGHV